MILLDTSGLLCYVYRDQPGHEEAVQLLDGAGKSITHTYVLAELVALAQVRHYPRLATLEFINDLLENPDIKGQSYVRGWYFSNWYSCHFPDLRSVRDWAFPNCAAASRQNCSKFCRSSPVAIIDFNGII